MLRFPHKLIRAKCIKEYMAAAGYDRAVCFSCGNAADALEAEGVDVVHIGERGLLTPNRWMHKSEIDKVFHGYFDATSGHLPVELMVMIGKAFRHHLGSMEEETIYIPTGSGETLVCLKMAYPDKRMVAVYNLDKATEYDQEAPLNRLVELLAEEIIK